MSNSKREELNITMSSRRFRKFKRMDGKIKTTNE
jgi:hypothetical protein